MWETDTFDLPRYLERVGFTGTPAADPATLTALHRAHLATVPFENLDLMLGRGVRVDLASVQEKLVTRRRGGYCFEHGTLFAAALTCLGFRVERLLARTGDDPQRPRARSHLVLSVGTATDDGDGDGRWLADVGFGSGLLEPIPLRADAPSKQGVWTYDLVRSGADTPHGGWTLRERRGGAWTVLYSFTDEPQFPIDIEVANHYVATYPTSPFLRRPIAIRKGAELTKELLGRRLSLIHPDRPAEERELADGEFAEVLRTEFGLGLAPEELAQLLAGDWNDRT